MPSVRVHLSPGGVSEKELTGGVAVVVDLLRASTTMTHALGAGAREIVACESIEEAREVARGLAREEFLLGGERGGVRIEGFDLGNSPAEYTGARVRDKTIVFTTTNGTIALHRSLSATRVVVGCFANLSAVAGLAAASGLNIHIVCAGIHGRPCREDSICAGAMVAKLCEGGYECADAETAIAREMWAGVTSLIDALRASEGGQNLISVGLGSDIGICAAADCTEVVPEWDKGSGLVRGAAS